MGTENASPPSPIGWQKAEKRRRAACLTPVMRIRSAHRLKLFHRLPGVAGLHRLAGARPVATTITWVATVGRIAVPTAPIFLATDATAPGILVGQLHYQRQRTARITARVAARIAGRVAARVAGTSAIVGTFAASDRCGSTSAGRSACPATATATCPHWSLACQPIEATASAAGDSQSARQNRKNEQSKHCICPHFEVRGVRTASAKMLIIRRAPTQHRYRHHNRYNQENRQKCLILRS